MKRLTWKYVRRLGQNDVLLMLLVLVMIAVTLLLAMSFVTP